MEAVCEITLLRHGQTVANVRGVIQGRLDSPLSRNGVAQCLAAGERLKHRPFDVCYSSDLGRALETVDLVNACRTEPLPVVTDRDLREWDLGALEGRPFTELLHEHPDFMRALNCKSYDAVTIPGGESGVELQARVSACFERLAGKSIGKSLLFVTHGCVLQCAFRHCVGDTDPRNLIACMFNASISRFTMDSAGAWRLITWNEYSHLEDLDNIQTVF